MSGTIDKGQVDLRAEAVRGTLWAYLSFVAGKGLTFISTIILARLLVPEQFGLVGYCLIAIQYLDVLNTVGMDVALISRRDRVEEAANAAFLIAIGTGLLLFAVSWMAAPAIATFFREEAVVPLFRLLALVLPLSSLGVVPNAMIQKKLRFKTKMIPDVGRMLAKGLVAIVLAWRGFGAVSLIWGQVIGEAVGVLLFWRLAGWRPTFIFDRKVTLEMLSFGGHIIVVGLVGALRSNIDYLIVGRVLGAAALGYYTIAYRIPELLIRNINFVVAKVAHPILAQVQSDGKEMRSVYFGYLRYISLFTIPAGVGLALVAPPFIRTFYTARWEPSIPVMQFVALGLAIAAIGHVPGVLYKAINRPDILNKLSLVKLPFTIAGLWYSARWGISAVAATQLLLSIFYVVVDSVVASRLVGFTLEEMFRALMPSLVASAMMAIVVLSIDLTLSLRGIGALLLYVALGGITYLAMLTFISRETVERARTVLRGAIARS